MKAYYLLASYPKQPGYEANYLHDAKILIVHFQGPVL